MKQRKSRFTQASLPRHDRHLIEIADQKLRSLDIRPRRSKRGRDGGLQHALAHADLVLLSHVTHDESSVAVEDMLRRAFAALRPGGKVAVHDWVVDSSRTGPLHNVMFSMNVMVYTDGGRVYSEREYEALMGRVGFVDVSSVGVLEGRAANPTRLITARRP